MDPDALNPIGPSFPLDEATMEMLAQELGASVARSIDHSRTVSLLFSGGIDSSLLACMVRGRSSLRPVVVGTRGSRDIPQALSAAGLIGETVLPTFVAEEEVRSIIVRWGPEVGALKEPDRSVMVALIAGIEAAPRGRVLCGQGADELFLGYAHFRGLSKLAARDRRDADLKRLIESEWPRAVRIANLLDRDLRSPYLDPEFVQRILATPIEWHLPGPTNKPILRSLARRAHVPEALVTRPKRAMQYGSGISRLVHSCRSASPDER